MTIVSTSYYALVVQYAINMLAGSATFAALPGVTTSLNAIIESDGGLAVVQGTGVSVNGTTITIGTTKNFAVVHATEFSQDEIALHTYGYNGVVGIDFLLTPTTGDVGAEFLREARNVVGAIAADISAQFGNSLCLARGTVTASDFSIPDETTDFASYLFASLAIRWSSP